MSECELMNSPIQFYPGEFVVWFGIWKAVLVTYDTSGMGSSRLLTVWERLFPNKAWVQL